MNKVIVILTLIVVILFAGNIFLGIKYYSAQNQAQQFLIAGKKNAAIINFNKLFVDKVLKTQGAVSYEDQLKLENAIIAIQDSEISDAWHTFLSSATEEEAQQNTLIILGLLPRKLIY